MEAQEPEEYDSREYEIRVEDYDSVGLSAVYYSQHQGLEALLAELQTRVGTMSPSDAVVITRRK